MCLFCGDTEIEESVTTHMVHYKKCDLLIMNVPCLVCSQCGETYYTDEVAEKLETMVDAIKNQAEGKFEINYQ